MDFCKHLLRIIIAIGILLSRMFNVPPLAGHDYGWSRVDHECCLVVVLVATINSTRTKIHKFEIDIIIIEILIFLFILILYLI